MIKSIKDCKKEDISQFDCGVAALNNYFIKYALANDSNNIGKTFVLTDKNQVIGFYTLASSAIISADLTEHYQTLLPKYPIPCILIARFAIDTKFQAKGYGHLLIKDALTRALYISSQTAIYFVRVDAKPESKAFYLKFGFTNIPNNQLSLLLPIATIANAVKAAK